MARPPAYLFTGPEHLLVRRAADQLLDELREEAGGELDITEVRGSDLGEDNLPDLRTASLFAIPRAYVVRDAQLLPKVAARALQREVEGATAEATIVLLSSGTKPILGLAKAIKAAGGRIDTAPPKEWEDKAWRRLVIDEFRRHQRVPTDDAVDAVLDASGLTVNGIAEKVAQASAATEKGTTVSREDVEQVVVGHGSRGAFAVADAMCAREPAEALRLLRGCLEAGDHPVMVLGALTYKMRQLIAVAAGLDGKAVGLSLSRPQVARLQSARSRFGPGELTAAVQHLAACDLEIKSGDLDPALAVERAVLGVASTERLPVPDPDREILR
ncbi:DNA polymerase III subunit delta [Euzebya sp.]|uniref:DNA polymerase III subunit delta n=1 Tax=Euzebya sp. TaxID=1971409 RepID=UPI0035145C93